MVVLRKRACVIFWISAHVRGGRYWWARHAWPTWHMSADNHHFHFFSFCLFFFFLIIEIYILFLFYSPVACGHFFFIIVGRLHKTHSPSAIVDCVRLSVCPSVSVWRKFQMNPTMKETANVHILMSFQMFVKTRRPTTFESSKSQKTIV